MNYLKRGFLSIVRKPAKTIILFLVVFILGMLMSGAVSVKKSINNTKKSINMAVEPVALIERDWEALQKDMESSGEEGLWQEIEYPDVDLIKTIGELEYVKYYDYNIIEFMTFRGEQDAGIAIPYASDTQVYEPSQTNGALFLHGVNYPDIMAIKEGTISLSDGRTLTEEEVKEGKPVAVISEQLAETNHLEVGSTLTTQHIIYDYSGEIDITSAPPVYEKYPVEMEVVGIYSIPIDLQQQQQGIADQKENTIYTTNGYVGKVQKDVYEKSATYYGQTGDIGMPAYKTVYSPVYILKEASMLDDFREEATALLPKYTKIIDTTEPYRNIIIPLENLGSIADTILIGAIVVSVLILSLLTTLFLHNRRHEIGVYISMGERKIKVVLQILVEVMTIAIISLSISLFVGNMLTKDMSKDMLLDDARVAMSNSGYQNYDFGGITTGYTVDSTVALQANYEVSLDGETVALFYGISIATIAVSTIIPTLYIVRLKPKKILM